MRIIPVLGSIPAVFGLVMASYVVTELAGMPVRPEPVLSIGLEHYRLLHERLVEREEVSAPPPGCQARRGPAASDGVSSPLLSPSSVVRHGLRKTFK